MTTTKRDRLENELARLRIDWRAHPRSRASIEIVAGRLTAQLAALDEQDRARDDDAAPT